MNGTRTYSMETRARAVEATRQRILEALFDLALERLFPDISLEDVAFRAGVSVQTVLRHFGNRDALVEATIAYGVSRVGSELHAPVGDVDAAVRAITDHNERRGDTSLMLLAQEFSNPQVERLTKMGRELHREWVKQVFAPLVAGNDELLRLLVVATDVYTWKILRRDMKLSRARTEEHLRLLIRALLAHPREGEVS